MFTHSEVTSSNVQGSGEDSTHSLTSEKKLCFKHLCFIRDPIHLNIPSKSLFDAAMMIQLYYDLYLFCDYFDNFMHVRRCNRPDYPPTEVYPGIFWTMPGYNLEYTMGYSLGAPGLYPRVYSGSHQSILHMLRLYPISFRVGYCLGDTVV